MIFGIQILALCAGLVFLLSLVMNLVRKNTTLISLYLVQSLTVAVALVMLSSTEQSPSLLYAALLTLGVKGIMAPTFLFRLIRKYTAHFSAASYLSTPLSLIVLAAITAFAYSVAPALTGSGAAAVPLLFAAIFSASFLMVNRRGALSAVIGVLALENGIVLLSTILGAAHTFALEFTIGFDIAVWIAIASAFLTMLYREFGMTDTDMRMMSHLTEE